MIERSVGAKGVNDHNDTLIIQCALNVARARQGLPPIAMDGLVGPKTIGAIVAFQRSKPPLAQDGRIDANGRTLAALTEFIGGEEFVFGPVVQELLAIKAELDTLLMYSPDRIKRLVTPIMPGLNNLSKYNDLTVGLPPAQTPALVGFNKGAPQFSFVGVDDMAAAMLLAMMALIMAIMLALMIQSPVFRKAVKVRAQELDRILKGLGVNSQVSLQDSVDIVDAIFTDTLAEEQRCRQSPTFTPTPECAEAMRAFAQIAAKMQNMLTRLKYIVYNIVINPQFPHRGLDVRKMRVDAYRLLAEVQQLAWDLQLAMADMREKCKCPDA